MEELYKFITQTHRVTFFKDTCELKNSPIPFENDNDFFRVPNYVNTHHTDGWFKERESTNEEDFEANYGNPFCSLGHHRHSVFISKDEKKINIKMFVYGRTRDQSKQWFRKYTECFFFTYNYVRNQMYMGTVTNYHKKRKFTKKIKQVSTDSNPLANVRTRLTSIIGLGFEKANVSSEEKMTMKTDEIQKIMEIFFNNIPGFKHEYHWLTSPDAQFYKFFLEKKEIKLPNNWQSLIYNYPQPKKKDYKKYKFKYVDAFMSVNNLKGDKIKRALHNINTCHPNSYQIACSYFGEKYILSQSDEILCSILQSFLSTSYKNLDKVLKTKKEKDNCFKIFKLCLDEPINDWTFNDHLRMYENLSTYEPVKWTSNDYDSFNEEHYQWSERFGFYTKGDFTRVYNNVFVNEVNKTINDGNIEYYPVVLSTSREYNMESFNQNNCVKNYVNRPSSFIISLRKDSADSKERATIEYRIRLREDGKICLDRVQTLGRFNQRLGSEWDKPIKDLDNRLNHILLNNKFDIPKLLIKIGNKVVKTEGTFEVDENVGFFNIKGEMKWKHNVDFIESIPEYYDIPY